MVKAPNSQPHTDIYHLLNLACFKYTGHYLPADGDETTKWKYRIVDGKKVAVMPRLNPRTILMPSSFHDFSKQVKLSMVVGELNSYFKPQPNEFKKLWEALEKDLAKDRTSKDANITHHLCITHPKPDDYSRGICFELEYYNEDERYPKMRSMGSCRVIGDYKDLAMYYLKNGELPPQSLADLMGWIKKHRQVLGTHLPTRSTNPYKVAEAFEGKARGLPSHWECQYNANPVRDWSKRTNWNEVNVEKLILHRVWKQTEKNCLKYWAMTMGRPKKSKQAWRDFYYDSIGKTIPCVEDWLEARWIYHPQSDDKKEVRGYARKFSEDWRWWNNRDIFAELWKQEPQMDAEDVMRIFAGVKGKSVEEKLVDYWC